jgi:hypothetical protein
MSRSSGPGQPLNARCSQCRRRDSGRKALEHMRGVGTLNRMQLTGRRRYRPNGIGGRVDVFWVYEYQCLDCRHVGWTRHIDVALRWRPSVFRVQKRLCASCIYRPDTSLDLSKLEADIADPNMAGHFKGFRECHKAPRGSAICCRGFWEKHRDHFDAGQLAQRLNLVELVDVDV